MIKFILPLLAVAFYFSSCIENQTPGNQDNANINSSEQRDIDAQPSASIDFSNLEQYHTPDSIFSFVAPRGFFISKRKGLQAVDPDFEMETQNFIQHYPCDPEEEILTIKSLQARFMKDISVTYKAAKTNFFVVSGLDQRNRIVYIKGDYSEFYSMRGREEGEPSLVWSKAGVIRFIYPQEKKADFNRIIEIISNSLRVNHDLM